MKTITSRSNEQIKYVANLQKDSHARYAGEVYTVEGIRMSRELPPESVLQLFISESFNKKNAAADIAGGVRDELITIVADDVFEKISSTKSPQGILALVKMPRYELSDLTRGGKGLLLLEEIQDPGNLGTILRSAEAAGLGGVILDEKCADIFSPKVVRSTMGSIFRVPFIKTDSFAFAVSALKESGYTIYAAHLDGEDIYSSNFSAKSAFLIGNEGNGLRRETSMLADKMIRIPMEGKVESLNASIAASLLAFEWRAFRRTYEKRNT